MASHPLFARIYERFSARAEERGQAAHRARALAGLGGRVVEVGAGNGLNFAHYPPTVDEVIAVEPEPYLRAKALARTAGAPVTIRVVDGDAESLPVGDGELDAVVFSLVLCSVPSQARALAEARRALRPGGELRFYEHVVSHRPRKAALQRAMTRLFWRRLAAGCELDRDTGTAIEAAGFVIEHAERIPFQGLAHLTGTARLPAA